jgi:hypothetical protein
MSFLSERYVYRLAHSLCSCNAQICNPYKCTTFVDALMRSGLNQEDGGVYILYSDFSLMAITTLLPEPGM